MADGITHARFNTGALIALGAGCTVLYGLYGQPQEIFFILPGALLSYFVDPDMMDQHQVTTHGERRLYKIFWPLGFIIECYMYPLAKLLSHRSIFSHLPGLNSLVRLLYLFGPMLYCLYGSQVFIDLWTNYYNVLIMLYLGSVIMDTMHALLDKFNFVW